MLQYHAKHLEEMFEVDSKSLRSSFNKSASLYAQSQALLKNLESHPLEQFFASMKSAVLQKLSEMEDKIK
jgi:hypothetical protein